MTQDISIIILAAGKGTRMKSDLPKVMHKIAGREMLNLVLDEAKKLNPKEIAVVVSQDVLDYQDMILSEHSDAKIIFALQTERKGTAHAAKVGFEALKQKAEKILILYGDTPLIEEETLGLMLEEIDAGKAVCVLGFESHFDNQYGRLVIDEEGNFEKIVEFKDATDDEKEITLCNSGVVAVDGNHIANLLAQVKNNNAPQEFYLTDIVAIARENGLECGFCATYEEEVLGVNSRFELAILEGIKQNQLRKKFMEGGVSLLDPATIYFSYDTKIESDVVIHQNVVFGVDVEISSGVEIKSFSHIEGAQIMSGAVVGPFARIRPNSQIGENVRVGNFVEIKNSTLKDGAKANHLAYIGDSEVGSDTNIGAGVITCNYDGFKKYKTEIGADVFIGSNSALIAPVKIGDGALIAAGSIITKNVEIDDLAVARSNQIMIKNGAKKYRNTKSKNEL